MFSQDALASFWNVQYAVWVDDSRKARIAKRLHGGAWGASVDLSAVAGTALSAQFNEDSHNVIIAGVDDKGYVHVSGNHHDAALKYMRTTKPADISAWSSPGMVGTEESSVTYPAFVRCRSGTLLFFYRDGSSGDGDLLCNVYNSTAGTWSRRAKIIDGKASSVNPYWQHIAVDRDTGRLHLVWMWRETADLTNHDLCYAYSDNEGVTWRKTDGTAYTLPITEATGEIVRSVPEPSGLMNHGGCDVDADGHPHAAYLQEDGGGVYQIHHLYHDGSAWHDDEVTDFAGTGQGRPMVVCFSTGTVWIVYHHLDTGIHAIDVTTPASPVDSVLYATSLLEWEPSYDTWALIDRDELHLWGLKERGAGAQGGDGDLAAQVNPPVLVFNEGSV